MTRCPASCRRDRFAGSAGLVVAGGGAGVVVVFFGGGGGVVVVVGGGRVVVLGLGGEVVVGDGAVVGDVVEPPFAARFGEAGARITSSAAVRSASSSMAAAACFGVPAAVTRIMPLTCSPPGVASNASSSASLSSTFPCPRSRNRCARQRRAAWYCA